MRYPFPAEDFEVLTDSPATDTKTARTVKLRPKSLPCTCKKCGSSEYTSDEPVPRKLITLDENGCITEITIMDTNWRCKSCRSRLECHSIPDYLSKDGELYKYSDDLMTAAVDALVSGYGSNKKVADAFEIKAEKKLREALNQRMKDVKRERVKTLMPCDMLVIYPFKYTRTEAVKNEDGWCVAIWGIADMGKQEYGINPYPILYDILPDFSQEVIANFLDQHPFEDDILPEIEFTSYNGTILAFLKNRYPENPVGVLRTFLLEFIGRLRNRLVLWKKDAGKTSAVCEFEENDTSPKPTTYQIRQEIRRRHQKLKEEVERAKYHIDMLSSNISAIEYGDDFTKIYKAWRESACQDALETLNSVLVSLDAVKEYGKYYGQYDYNMELETTEYEGTYENDDIETNYMEWQMRFVKAFKKAGVPFDTMCYRVWSCVAAQNNEGIPPRLLLRSDYAGTGITGFRINLDMLNKLFADVDLTE